MYLRKRLQIIVSLLLISSIMCNHPGSQTPEESASPLPEAGEVIDIIKEEIITERVDAYAADLFAHPETGELMDIIQANGYTTLVEGGDFELSNGEKIHAVSITDGNSAIILAQSEKQPGAIDTLVYAFPNENTVYIWDQNGGVEITFNEDGQIDYTLMDTDGNPSSSVENLTTSHYKTASILPQTVPACTSGMGEEFDHCAKRISKSGNLSISKTVLANIVAGIAVCVTPPHIGCAAGVVGFLTGFVTTGAVTMMNFRSCFREMTDDPPTSEYSTPEETEIYHYCRDGNLYTEKLYKVEVNCMDDRRPPPEDHTFFLTSGEAGKEYTCTNCAGKTSKGNIPGAGEIVLIECEYGCQIVGDGQARCLEEGETPQEEVVTIDPALVGTYEGTTNALDLYSEVNYGEGKVTENNIIITIFEDGTVSGSFIAKFDSGLSDPVVWEGGTCVSQMLITLSGILYGQISGPSGPVGAEISQDISVIRTGCANEAEYPTTINDITVNISISGDTLIGSEPDSGFTFEATKTE